MKLAFESDTVGGSGRGGEDVFVTVTATHQGTRGSLRALLADETRFGALLTKAHNDLLPWAECDGDREAWDGKTDAFLTEAEAANLVERELPAEAVLVLPVLDHDVVVSRLVTGRTRNYDHHVEQDWDDVRAALTATLRDETQWASRLDDPTRWGLTAELFREGNAE